MNAFTVSIFLNLSLVFAAIAGWVRLQPAIPFYFPFLLFAWTGLLNECLSIFLIYSHHSNAINSNLYVLGEYFLLLYQFYTWRSCSRNRLFVLTCLGCGIWLADNFCINSLTDNNSLFRFFSSFVIVLFSIDRMNQQIVRRKYRLLKDPIFLICAGLQLYYGCKIFMEVANLFQLPFSALFYEYLWMTLSIINCIANIVYAIAIVCIPKRQEFMLPY